MNACLRNIHALTRTEKFTTVKLNIYKKICLTARVSNDVSVIQMLHLHKTRQIKNAN